MQPKKTLGQHWLHDKAVLRSIVVDADVKESDEVLEIGPGLGTLTDELVTAGAKVTALEFDESLVSQLKFKYYSDSKVNVIHGDIRRFNYDEMPEGYKIVANIPYYLTSHLIRQLTEVSNKPTIIVLLVQKEVAERICAEPGKMSLLSFAAQWHYDCTLSQLVPAKLFTPPPKVDSQVVILKPSKELRATTDWGKLINLVKAGFSEKRKTLANSLSGGLALPKAEVSELLKSANIDPMRRAQTLSLDDWDKLYSAYTAQKPL